MVTPAEYRAVMTAARKAYAAKIAAHGIDCPDCEGSGDIALGMTERSRSVPREVIYERCFSCAGRGAILPETESSPDDPWNLTFRNITGRDLPPQSDHREKGRL